MPKTKKLAVMAVLTAMALGIFVLEAQIPSPIPVPGVKLGLANIITLVTIKLLGKKEGGIVLLMRLLLGAMFVGSPSTLLFSLGGGILAYLVMVLMNGQERLWITSAIAAIAHNCGQMLICVLVVKTPGVLFYAPILAASGVVTGLFTGIAAQYLCIALKKVKF